MFHRLSTSVRLLLCIHTCLGITLEKRFPLNRNGLQFTNMIFNGSLIYAAENGSIHALYVSSLSVQHSYPTCTTDECGNINKVLIISNSTIVACGTGNNGFCQKWENGILAYNTSSQSSIQKYPLVSTNIHRPAVGLVHNGYLYMGVSNGDVFGETKRYLLTQTDLTKNFSLASWISLLNKIYLVYFRKIFMKGDFVYFLTNQKQALTTAGYKTKLIRICTNGSNWTKSYTDIVLGCEAEGVDYNLLQDAEFLPSTGKLVAVFSIGDDPEIPTAESAICVYTIDAVDDAILRAKKDFVTCSTNNSTNEASAYLDIELIACVSNMTYQKKESEYECPSTGGTKVIGTITLQSNSGLKLAENSNRITKVRGIDRFGLYSDVYLGTDKGTISKVSIDDGLNIVVYESNVPVDKGHTVRDIHITDNHFYVLSNRKVFRFKDTECSEYKTCEVTMKSKNPSCGWCVIENRSSKRTDCMNRTTWLSSLSACVSADITPKYMPVKPSSVITNVTINLSGNFTSKLLQYSLGCIYLRGKERIGPFYPSFLCSNGSIACNAPGIDEPGEIRVQLLTNTSQKVVAESTFQVYKCNQFSNCASCLVSPEVNCKWCSNLQCNETCVGADDPISSTDSCPSLVNTSGIYIPNGINKTISLNVTNLQQLNGHYYSCILKNTTVDRNALVDFDSSTIKCSVNFSYGENVTKSEMPISVVEAVSGIEAQLKDDFNNTATVYKCEQLATDCTMCNALNKDRYDCHWCVEGGCGHKSTCMANNTCPLPIVTKVEPPAGGYLGFTNIILEGKNFGTTKSDISEVKIGIYPCEPLTIPEISNPDFEGFIQQIQCKLPRTYANTSLVGQAEISIKFNGTDVKTGRYRFSNPTITSVTPNFTSLLGGTVITLSGTDLDVGNTLDRVRLGISLTCSNHVYRNSSIVCTTPEVTTVLNTTKIKLKIDDEGYESEVLIKFLPSPDIEGLVSAKSAVSGGSNFTVRGKNLLNAAEVTVCSSYAGETSEGNLMHATPSSLTFQSPPAPPAVLKELRENENGQGRRRRKRSTFDPSITVEVTIKMDGYEKTYPYTYFKDPVFEEFSDFEATKIIRSKKEEIVMEGSYLNLAAKEADYRVSIGKFGTCYVTLLTETNLTCVLPAQNLDVVDKLEVHVELGFFRQKVGYVKYDLPDEEGEGNSILVIVLAVIGGLVLISVIGSVFGVFKYTRVKRKAKKIEKSLATMEMKIKEVVLEEFLDMHTTLSRVNESLVEIGFPYNSYQRYSFLMMFPGEWNMEEHPLMHRPDVPDETALRGMDTFEELLLNKFFLLSVISTMQKQKKFFLKEKCNMAGYLSVILLGKMEYFHEEILTKLLTNLVSGTPAKSQKTLFRRCESITEKLLSNWLALSLYHQVKIHSGSPLYMLLKGTQLTMESGPIDAITGNSKYTLSEEKLLRQDDKPNTLTLRIMVENNEEIRDCKVLDCDTISQVKAKCLNQIYVNYPASQLTVDSSELSLEWHWGIGGRIVIKDEDTSSKREGRLLQLNTLEHYRVQDESSMALVDPCGMIDQEDYMNLAQVRVNIDTGNNDQMENPQDEVDGPLTRWHLMKPDTEEQKSAVTDELYLSRLVTTKQSVLEFMRSLFKSIFDNAVPPPAKNLFDLLDRLGEENKVDPDVVHAWKSHCYLIRFWGTLISKPYNLFDQRIPPYVETSMEVLSQVLIESCSLKASQYTKDSSPGKLIFKTDMMTYREEVKSYYTRARDTLQTPEEFRDYLRALNQFQNNQMSFNKQTALYTLYLQLQPYMDEIMEDLENNTDTKNLHLDRKLANLNNSMQEED